MNHYSKYYPQFMLLMTIISHLALIPMIMYATASEWIISIILYFFITSIGMSMTYHRNLSDRLFESPLWLERLGTLLATYGNIGSSLSWVAIHRHHHGHSDKPTDVHSPKHVSWARIYFMIMFVKVNFKKAGKLLRDPFHVFLHRHYILIHIAIMAILYMIEPFAVIYAYLIPSMLSWFFGSCIFILSHTKGIGYRSYETDDDSNNCHLLGFLVFGEGYHNNHHGDARKGQYMFGRKWYEIDVTGYLIKIFKK